MVKILILCVALIGLAAGKPETSGPYPAKGWKPQGARLELPSRNYGVPQTDSSVIELTTLTNSFEDSQSGDSNDDALRVQALPAVDAVSQFKSFQRQRSSLTKARQPASAQIQMPPAPAFGGKPFLLSSLFAPQFASANEQLQEMKFGQQQQQQFASTNEQQQARNFGQQQQEKQFGQQQQQPDLASFGNQQQQPQPFRQQQQPQLSQLQQQPQFASFAQQQQQTFSQQQQQTFGQQQQLQVPEFNNPKSDAQPFPAQTYGPPKTNDEPEVEQTDELTEDDDDQDSSDDSTIAVANAASAGNLVEATQQGQVGQYYILLPDNSLQKVRFATKQTEDDLQFNGFSAQLR
jgi:hypothetical protein